MITVSLYAPTNKSQLSIILYHDFITNGIIAVERGVG